MRVNFCLIALSLLLVKCERNQSSTYQYPIIENIAKTETHFETKYINQFSNLEHWKDTMVTNWFKKQDALTEAYFDGANYRKVFERHESLENRDSDPASNVVYVEAGYTFFLSQGAKKDIKHLYRKKTNDQGQEKLYDPSTYKGGDYEIEYYKPSYNGEFVAIALGKTGNFFNDVLILDCKSKKVVGESILNAKPNKAGGIVWSPDNKCISYIAYPNQGDDPDDRNSYTALYCFENQNRSPIAIFKDGVNGISLNPEYYPVPRFRSSKSNYMFIYNGNASDFWDCYYLSIEDFERGVYNWKKLYSEDDKILHSWGMERNHRYYYKRIHNNNIEFCSVDLRTPDFKNPKIIAFGSNENQIGSVKVTKDRVYYTISTNGISESLYCVEKDGKSKKIDLPISAGEISLDYRSPYHDDLWVKLSGWTSNPRDYYLNKGGNFEFVELGMWPNYPEFENIISEVVEVTSHDGTKIPLSIVRRRDHKFDSKSMGIITAYGAYGISETPWFHSPVADFVNQGNIYASAHVRGGGEKGPKWHEAGMKSTKENSWKDLIACSEFLIDKKYIHSKKLGLNINSAGGITGGMAVNERPELFGVFTGFVPTLNVIRTEYLEEYDDSDITFEFGTIKEEKEYKSLIKMDPVVNLSEKKEYPSTMLIMGFNDYLVPPSGPGKYIALLQSFNTIDNKPYLLDVKFDAEHEIDWLNDYSRMLFFTMSELERRN
ncbi:prolyl oligopeptidase family serine peptidase [Flagellimonas sp. S3867]|uniref:prolyl oligopeptidase family serine peptidase n=1 Tax=Flagellimonas sp. S3867 TaxID=2768063 RepID=UPI00168300B5|nr:prolyl oligopeptidase family serine peptidase [Flagellimonas sp. S3867]